MSIFFSDLKHCIAWYCVNRLLRLENIYLVVYYEEEALQGKGKLSFLHLISWISGKVLDRSCSLSVLKVHNWKKSLGEIKGEISIFLLTGLGVLTGLLFGFWFGLSFFVVVTTSLSLSLRKGRGFFR